MAPSATFAKPFPKTTQVRCLCQTCPRCGPLLRLIGGGRNPAKSSPPFWMYNKKPCKEWDECSMGRVWYIYLHEGLIFIMVNVCKFTIHGSYG